MRLVWLMALTAACVELRPGGDRADARATGADAAGDAVDERTTASGCGAPGQGCCETGPACASGACNTATRRCP